MRVLLVEDSRAVRAYVEGILRGERDIEVLPGATDGAAGVRLAQSHRPDIVLMDLELPVVDGIEAIRRIMETAPCPIVVLSAYLDDPVRDRTFESLQAGAVDVLAKPRGLDAGAIASFRERLLSAVRWMSKAVVVRRRPAASAQLEAVPQDVGRRELVVVGASTGGPQVLAEILRALRPPSPRPIVVAQHIVPGFEYGLVTWLAQTGHRVVVVDGDREIEPGTVHVARADRHLAIRAGQLSTLDAGSGGHVPSVDVLFRSAADSYGGRVLGVLLSGMGDDGARGLLALRERGALTVTQAGATCVVDGMPSAARARHASVLDLAPHDIALLLARLAMVR